MKSSSNKNKGFSKRSKDTPKETSQEINQESIQEHKKKLKQMQIKLRNAASAYENITSRYNKHEEFKRELQEENLLDYDRRKEYFSAPPDVIEKLKKKKLRTHAGGQQSTVNWKNR